MKGNIWNQLKQWARQLKKQTFLLYLAYRHPNVPWYAKVWAICVVAYAFSPIDLIPDFIPVLGYLDDLILIPLGVAAAMRMLPENVISECRAKADELMKQDRPTNWVAGGLIIVIWILLAGWFWITFM